MIGNIAWCALTNIRRKKIATILFFVLSMFTASTLFLGIVAARYLGFPEITELKRFFSVLVFTIFAVDIMVLCAIALFFARSRQQELGIYRIHGAKKFDILFLNSLEILLVSFFGALTGVLVILFLILGRVLDLPYFFQGVRNLRFLRLIGTSGQVVFGIIIIELALTSFITMYYLKRGDADLLRGSP